MPKIKIRKREREILKIKNDIAILCQKNNIQNSDAVLIKEICQISNYSKPIECRKGRCNDNQQRKGLIALFNKA